MKKLILCGILFLPALLFSQGSDKRPYVRSITQTGLMYFNGANFDFTETTKAHYVGHINLFAPGFIGQNYRSWGFNAGILRLKYNGDDTLLNTNLIENVQIDPLRTVHHGDKYLRQLNNYTGSVKRTSTSYYFQPLYRIEPFSRNDRRAAQLFVHAHTELLVSKWSSSVNVTTLAQDTATWDANAQTSIRSGLANAQNYTSVRKYGYFGAGVTLDFCPWDNVQLFVQPTVGITTDYPQFIGASVATNLAERPLRPNNKKINGFYLVRGYYTQTLSDGAVAVLGVDVRGFLPTYSPDFTAYVGVSLKLDEFFGLLGAKTATLDQRTKKTKTTSSSKPEHGTTTSPSGGK
jgi:hypothetical protein